MLGIESARTQTTWCYKVKDERARQKAGIQNPHKKPKRAAKAASCSAPETRRACLFMYITYTPTYEWAFASILCRHDTMWDVRGGAARGDTNMGAKTTQRERERERESQRNGRQTTARKSGAWNAFLEKTAGEHEISRAYTSRHVRGCSVRYGHPCYTPKFIFSR